MDVDTPFIKDSKKALIGAINGVVLYDFFWSILVYKIIWPLVILTLMQLIIGTNYVDVVNEHYYTIYLILSLFTSLLTLIISIFIAGPKELLTAYRRPEKKSVKLIFATLGIMLLATFVYNLFLMMCGIDIAGGNANQTNVVELIMKSPILAFIAMIIMAPILEEVTYRYFIYGGIAKFNRRWAIVISGFIFMCVHATASFTSQSDNLFRELILLPPYMFSGMALAYAYDKSENLLIPTSIHALNNLISFILCFI